MQWGMIMDFLPCFSCDGSFVLPSRHVQTQCFLHETLLALVGGLQNNFHGQFVQEQMKLFIKKV